MASVVHAGSPIYPPPPTFSQNSTESSANGLNHSNSTINSFDGHQSIATTPTLTPPPSRYQQNMQYSMPAWAGHNGAHSRDGTPRRYAGAKPFVEQQRYPEGPKPQIYTAVYSGVSVYEMEINNLAVMRRRSDSKLNATQILKLAGIEKGKRTKVLEKEILSGDHEKVQGGYGKYQGTWIDYRRGTEFARQYGVEELLRPLLEYDMGQDGSMAGAGPIDTPTKEQAMAAQRKRNMMNGGNDSRIQAQSPNGTFFKNISKTAANAVNAITKARFDSPGPRQISNKPIHRPSQQMGSQESGLAGSSQQSMQSLHTEQSFGENSQLDPALRPQEGPSYPVPRDANGDSQEPPRKRIKQSASQDPFACSVGGACDATMREASPSVGSFAYHHRSSQEYTLTGLPALPQPSSSSALEKQRLVSSLFLDSNETDFTHHKASMHLSGEDWDIPIDTTAHTAMHWAATLARTSILRALIRRGASIYRLNGGGETALIRAALTTNNLDQGSFPELLELLHPTIEIRDGRGRTVLHHIAVSSAVKGRSAASRYYLESLLEFVVRQGTPTNSQQNSFQDSNTPAGPKCISLVKFMSDIVNAVDMAGDTALNLAARIGNKSIISQLLEIGADPTIPNRGGLKPVDFGVGGEPDAMDVDQKGQLSRLPRTAVSKVTESSQELIASISTILSDTESSFRAEMQSKQSLIDQTHSKLRETNSLMNEERKRLTDLQRKSDERKALRQRIANLRRANEHQRMLLTTSNLNSRPGSAPVSIRPDIKVGEADAGLDVNTTVIPLSLLDTQPAPNTQPSTLAPHQREYLNALPPAPVLQARVSAYRKNNDRLEALAKGLQSQSSELEAQLRKVVSLCTGVEERRVDEMLEGLSVAVESEGGGEAVEVGRVREFLRRVDGGVNPGVDGSR